MAKLIRRSRPKIYRRAQRGQSLIVALAVLFVLLFIGGLFVSQIARNLAFAGRNRDTGIADQLADAGVSYCNDMLTNSEDGADWRPLPTGPLNNAGPSDPDYEWLSQGFARISGNGGRVLVHVTFDPHPDNPLSQMLRIDSIGRPGDLGNGLDPTVFVQNGPAPRLRSERVAYKKIGLTDYLRFITDKDLSHSEAVIGTPPGLHNLATVLGDPSVALHPTGINNDNLIFGAPIFSNAPLRFVGDTFLYESPRGNATPTTSAEGIFVADSILLGPTRTTTGAPGDTNGDFQVGLNVPINGAANYAGVTIPDVSKGLVLPSSNPQFDTHQGIIRDASTGSDINGFSRSISRLDPPVIDNPASGTDIPRYRAMSRDSGVWVTPTYNSGQGGWGRNIYINNPTDLQRETSIPGLNGSFSLRSEWLNPDMANGKNNWDGLFYRPPGVQIELLGDHIRITRNDSGTFQDPMGNPITQAGGKVIDIPLRDIDRSTYVAPNGTKFALNPLDRAGDDPTNTPRPFGDVNSYGVNLVLYAEGNVRVRGIYGAVTDLRSSGGDRLSRVHITIVTNGTAYIEGNIVKGDGYLDTSGSFHPERASSLALLAKDYVCLNTTMFMAAQTETSSWNAVQDTGSFATDIGQTLSYDMAFGFGVDPTTYNTTNGTTTYSSPLFVMLRHAAAQSPAFINLLLNPTLGTTSTANGVSYSSSAYVFDSKPNALNTLGDPQLLFAHLLGEEDVAGTILDLTDGAGTAPNFEQRAFALRGQYIDGIFKPNYYTPDNTANVNLFFPTLVGVNHSFSAATADGPPLPGYDNILRFQLDPGTAETALGKGSFDYLLSGAVVAPLDIRIEALLYAQEKSFFIIPGYSLNPDAGDTREAYNLNSAGFRKGENADDNPTSAGGNALPQDPSRVRKIAKDVYPFYNEPTDVRITIYGAIAENHTASQGDQAAWLARWGYTPVQMGSSTLNVPDDHLHVHDPVLLGPGNTTLYQYNPAEDRTADFRTVLESSQSANGEFPITHTLRYEYDPAFALPYSKPSDPTTAGGGTADETRRNQHALRFVIHGAGGNTFIEKLPALPRLPVCQGKPIEFIDDQRTIGGP